MKIGPLLGRLRELESELAEDYRALGERHADEHDVHNQCKSFAKQAERHASALASQIGRYDEGAGTVWADVLEPARGLGRAEDGLQLLGDLRALFLAAEEVSITWVMAGQAAQAARDSELLAVVSECHGEVELQVKWLTTRIKVAAPQVLVVG